MILAHREPAIRLNPHAGFHGARSRVAGSLLVLGFGLVAGTGALLLQPGALASFYAWAIGGAAVAVAGAAVRARLRTARWDPVPLVVVVGLACFSAFLLAGAGASGAAIAGVNCVMALAVLALVVGRLRPFPTVLLLGDGHFCSEFSRGAVEAGRRVLAELDAGELAGPPLLRTLLGEEMAFDEMVIQGECFAQLQEIPAALRGRARRVLVAPADRAEARFYADPIPVLGRIFKRVLDLALAPAMLMLLLPLLAVIGLVVCVDSPGSPIFRQERVGRDGRRFILYKFRTMAIDNDDAQHQEYVKALIEGGGGRHHGLHKLAGDPRITNVGRFLRNYSLDELPQLWNVIRGDMTLVGPRPPLPREVELYDPRSWQRLRAQPGLTGLWQVSGRSLLGFREMVELDIRYWRSWTPLLDLSILVRTPWVVISARGVA